METSEEVEFTASLMSRSQVLWRQPSPPSVLQVQLSVSIFFQGIVNTVEGYNMAPETMSLN